MAASQQLSNNCAELVVAAGVKSTQCSKKTLDDVQRAHKKVSSAKGKICSLMKSVMTTEENQATSLEFSDDELRNKWQREMKRQDEIFSLRAEIEVKKNRLKLLELHHKQ